MLDLYIFETDKINQEKDIPFTILNHCKQYKNNDSYIQSIKAWTKLIWVLKQYGIDLFKEELDFSHNKPSLKNNKIYFNISHSYDLIAIAISDSECGCDIEKNISPIMLETLGNRLIETNKWKDCKSILEKQNFLTSIWTQKETYIKLNGFDINKVEGECIINMQANTDSILHLNQHYWYSVMNKNNEKAKIIWQKR